MSSDDTGKKWPHFILRLYNIYQNYNFLEAYSVYVMSIRDAAPAAASSARLGPARLGSARRRPRVSALALADWWLITSPLYPFHRIYFHRNFRYLVCLLCTIEWIVVLFPALVGHCYNFKLMVYSIVVKLFN